MRGGVQGATNDFEDLGEAIGGVGNGLGALNLGDVGLPGSVPGFANGGNFTVPSGYNNDDFMIGLSSGEEVNITPAGASTTNFNMTNNISSDGGPIGRDFAFDFQKMVQRNTGGIQTYLKSLAGA
ncbi:unnamed protein product [marine sediment metagenome]|uniref:Uncharacterized protein n=1 Tax=marine sediment metagenome TaxID=412755 RepID=X0Y2R7_9ZZZZ